MRFHLRACALTCALTLASGCASPSVTPGPSFAPRELVNGPESAAPVPASDSINPRTELAGAVDAITSQIAISPATTSRAGAWRTDALSIGMNPSGMRLTAGDEPGAATGEPSAAPAGESSAQELAKKLANPIASLISVPFQSNWDSGFGADGRGRRYVLNVQPVIPISLNDEWNVISRTIVPIIDQHEMVPGTGDQSGVGDITQSLFLSPKAPTDCGWIWGVGPAFLVPTAGNDLLGSGKWGAGPTAVVLKQECGWTYGALVNQIWSFAGSGNRNEVNASFMQPFLSYTTPDVWTFALNAEATYDWLADDLGVPINLMVSKLVRLGRMPVQFQLGTRWWAERTEYGAEGFGFRFNVVFLLPAGK